MVYGGEFLKVNNKASAGPRPIREEGDRAEQVRARSRAARRSRSAATSLRAGEVRLSWTANTDRDNETLTYQVFRQDKGSTPLYTVHPDSNFWTTPRMTYVDKTALPGTTYQYRVRAIDPMGNQATGAWTTITATTTNQATDYSLLGPR